MSFLSLQSGPNRTKPYARLPGFEQLLTPVLDIDVREFLQAVDVAGACGKTPSPARAFDGFVITASPVH
jgi:hypothetical protein